MGSGAGSINAVEEKLTDDMASWTGSSRRRRCHVAAARSTGCLTYSFPRS